jgi:2-phosphosulfolactate phosphatase
MSKKADVCFSPVMYPAYRNEGGATVVVVDIFRATTCICTAFENGVKKIIPVETLEEAVDYRNKGYLVAAERNVRKCDFADFGNSPFDFSMEKVGNQEIVFTTTNGTRAIHAAVDAKHLIIGSFLNLSSAARFCSEKGDDVVIVCSGWNDRFNIEDTLFAGALAFILKDRFNFEIIGDSAVAAIDLWEKAKSDLVSYLNKSEHIVRLKANGQEKAIEYCLRQDVTSLVPKYVDGYLTV